MSDDELRIKVAELRGYRWLAFPERAPDEAAEAIVWKTKLRRPPETMSSSLDNPELIGTWSEVRESSADRADDRSLDAVPRYPGDLNAMREAEKTLGVDDIARYFNELKWLMDETNTSETAFVDKWYFRATARQRAEAFVKAFAKQPAQLREVQAQLRGDL